MWWSSPNKQETTKGRCPAGAKALSLCASEGRMEEGSS